jgi:hypothetical protein
MIGSLYVEYGVHRRWGMNQVIRRNAEKSLLIGKICKQLFDA